MDNDNNKPTTDDQSTKASQAPADALSRTPEDLEQERAAEQTTEAVDEHPGEKKRSPLMRFLRRINVYFLLFLLVVVIAVIYMIITYYQNQNVPVPPEATVPTQKLSSEALKQLANTDASVGKPSQTLTIKGNAVIDGETLMRGNLNVAGNLQSGGSFTAPSITVSGKSNFGDTQVNTLQVAQNFAVQGNTSVKDLSVAGSGSFAGPLSASQITTSKLIISGNGVLQIPSHLSFTGAPVGRTPGNALGNGGSVNVNGSDTSGTVNINTGGGTAPGCFTHINFAQSYAATPHVIVSPIGSGAGQTQYYVNRTTGGFDLCTANAAPAGQSFAFDYFVAG